MIQLRIRTEYSFGQTFAPIGRVIKRLKEINCTAAGIVDGSTWGHVAWVKACKEAGIQSLLGVECSVTLNGDETAPKMWFLTQNKTALSELYRVISKSHQQLLKTRYRAVNRLYEGDVLKMSDGILKFAGDVTNGEFLKQAGAYVDLNPSSRILNSRKRTLATEHGLRVVSTSDNSFAFEDDRDTFELTAKTGLKPTPMHILGDLSHQGEAAAIAQQCSELELPHAPGLQVKGDLEALCREGVSERFGDNWTQEYEDRLMYELKLIRSKNYESYFIIVADMVHYAKKYMLVGPSRGSAAGSLVCYLSRITEIDPIPPGLFFERFIDISRSDLPDIDLDFPDNKRQMVFDYMSEKYGINNVTHIGTISTFRPKSALIQVCKALNIPPSATAAVKIAMFERSVADARANKCLEDTMTETSPGREFIKQYPEAIVATMLEGHASHAGVHAAGLLVCDDEITNYAVVDSKGIAHVEKGAAEYLGLLKIDVLGLRTLGILEDSGVDIDWYNLKFDDPVVFKIFNDCRLCGIFQFDGEAMRSISTQIKFKTINEIDAVTALARPGPFGGGVTLKYIRRMNGEPYGALHPLVAEHMKDTFGLPIYQEQTLAIVREVGGFDWEQTSAIRKAVSKRLGKEYFEPFWLKFREGAMAKGIDETAAQQTWQMINAMGAWQMNKAHTFSYAVISYWTAYLKAHHPMEFAAANLRNAKDTDNAIMLLREMDREGIKYIPFSLKMSEVNWCAKDGKLYGGFTALRGIGSVKAKKLIDARGVGTLTEKQLQFIEKAENPFKDIFPFHTNYQNLYDDPDGNGIAGDISEIDDINFANDVPHGEERVFLGELIYKNPRNANEQVNIKKRDGKVLTGPLEYIDVRLRDDHGVIGGRIGRFDFNRIGRDLLEKVPVGSYLLIRAKFFNGIPWAFITRWRRIDE